jgi:hypothetical protein
LVNLREQELETSNGIILVELYDIEQFECLGIVKPRFGVLLYDFLAHGITSDYDGVVGSDFLRERMFCIEIMNEITIDI